MFRFNQFTIITRIGECWPRAIRISDAYIYREIILEKRHCSQRTKSKPGLGANFSYSSRIPETPQSPGRFHNAHPHFRLETPLKWFFLQLMPRSLNTILLVIASIFITNKFSFIFSKSSDLKKSMLPWFILFMSSLTAIFYSNIQMLCGKVNDVNGLIDFHTDRSLPT